MVRILTNLDVQKPDRCHLIGQTLLKPASIAFGHSFCVENGVGRELPVRSALARSAALALLILPLSVIGAVFLSCSKTHRIAYDQVQNTRVEVVWKEGRPEIRTKQLLLRPIQAEDLSFYQNLFSSPVVMERYLNGPRDITNRFLSWLKRWDEHTFSALAVVDAKENKVIGHVISGHGDYEGNFENGCSEPALVIDAPYWNADFKDESRGIGTAGKRGIGTEAFRGVVAYLKDMKEKGLLVPCDVVEGQRKEVEQALDQDKDLRVHRNEAGEIDWVCLPLTELRGNTSRKNPAAHKILTQIAVKENGGVSFPKNEERDFFVVKFS